MHYLQRETLPLLPQHTSASTTAFPTTRSTSPTYHPTYTRFRPTFSSILPFLNFPSISFHGPNTSTDYIFRLPTSSRAFSILVQISRYLILAAVAVMLLNGSEELLEVVWLGCWFYLVLRLVVWLVWVSRTREGGSYGWAYEVEGDEEEDFDDDEYWESRRRNGFEVERMSVEEEDEDEGYYSGIEV